MGGNARCGGWKMARSDTSERDGVGRRASSPPAGARDEMTLPLSDVMQRLARRWGKEDEYCMWVLRRRWAEVVAAPWAQNVQPVGVDEDERLVVSVPHAASLKMELQRKGARWRTLLDGVRAISGRAFEDVVVQDSRRRLHTRGKG